MPTIMLGMSWTVFFCFCFCFFLFCFDLSDIFHIFRLLTRHATHHASWGVMARPVMAESPMPPRSI